MVKLNRKYSEIWPNITEKKDPPADHEKYKDEQDKFKNILKKTFKKKTSKKLKKKNNKEISNKT